ncbi:MAG TPA: TonB-dependent receptor [Caulobacteraceae bacterium]|jgi:hypothetical protein|nr:TonB-dependent receptor [Caulobacteraceae bacterium]
MLINKLIAGAALCALSLAASGAYAQEITGGVAGHVIENGKPVAGAQVKVTNPANGVTVATTSGEGGFYSVRNLPPGGPYTVTATAPDKSTDTQNVDQVTIGAPYDLDFTLGGAAVSEVTVTASPVIRNLTIATGPRTTLSARDISQLPSFAGDLHDLVRLSPFVTIDEANSNALIIAGANNHTNTIYLDGARQSDNFGLNNNGYPTQRTPFSLDIVQSLNLEVAPYDVQYGNFQGGIVNVVTKSGTNNFHGSASYTWDSSANSGKVIGADALFAGIEDQKPAGAPDRAVTNKFSDKDSSFTIGGPLWTDHMFFFFGYDTYLGTGGSGAFVPQDVAGANLITGVLQSDVTKVQTDLKSLYNYDPLNYGGQAPVENTDIFAKFDWYITSNQHLWFTYQETDGTLYNTPDGSVSSKELNLASSDYLQAQNLIAYTGDLTSNWTPDLSTEVQYVYRTVTSPSELLTAPFANMLVSIPLVTGPPQTGGGSIDLGPDISRQANNLGVNDQQFRARAHYTLGDNVVTAGYEWERTSEFDLFVQDATGAYTFNDSCGPGIGNTLNGEYINLEAHVACKFTYQNAVDNNPATAAGTVVDYTNTLYAEDEWHVMPGLTVTGGLRYERYTSPDQPLLNPRFVAQYGFDNNLTTNGESILMPRAGFNWRPDPTLTITGGIGLFSGGNPDVYTYDSFDNPGNLLGTHTYTCSQMNCATQASALTVAGATAGTPALLGVTGSSIPVAVQNDITASANLGTGNANALAPGFKPPSEWKASLSISKLIDFTQYADKYPYISWLGNGWRAHIDLLGTKVKDAPLWQDLWEEQNQLTSSSAALLGIAAPNGTAPDGRPLFNPNRYLATPPGTPAGTTRTSGEDILLTDTNQGYGIIWALGVEKTWPWGLDIDYTYTGQDVKDVNPATSSVATSNYINNISADPNHPSLATSSYEIRYEHKLTVSFSHKFFGDETTSFRLFLYNRAGLPYSYAFCPTSSSVCATTAVTANFDELFGQYSSTTMHQLLYVPKADSSGNVTATSDPLVTYGSGFNVTQFNTFLHSSGLIKFNGKISPRNAFNSSPVNTGDIQISQELPAFGPNGTHGAHGEVFLDIINVLNLINKNWGIDNQVGFPYEFAPVTAVNCQFSGLVLDGVVMPTCTNAAGGVVKGNFYQYNALRPQVTSSGASQFSTVQTLAEPPVATWVLKFGIRYKF